MVRSTHQPINESLNRMYTNTGHTGNILSHKPNRISSAGLISFKAVTTKAFFFHFLLQLDSFSEISQKHRGCGTHLHNLLWRSFLQHLTNMSIEMTSCHETTRYRYVDINFAALNSRCSILKIKDLCEF